MARACLRFFCSYLSYPITFGGGLLALLWLVQIGTGWGMGLFVVLATITIALLVLERLAPFQHDSVPAPREVLRDGTYVLLNKVVRHIAIFALELFGINYFYLMRPTDSYAGTGPLGLILALVLFELIRYWYHRGLHLTNGRLKFFLWCFHSIHHLPNKMYSSTGFVGHPVLLFFQTEILFAVPLLILGTSGLNILLYRYVIGFHVIFTHVNLDVRLGWLNYLVSGPETHRIHHAVMPSAGKYNYSTAIVIFDHLFGTFRMGSKWNVKSFGLNGPIYPNAGDFVSTFFFPLRQLVSWRKSSL